MNTEDQSTSLQIAGVVGDARYHGLKANVGPVLYAPYDLWPGGGAFSATLLVRSPRPPSQLASEIRQAVGRLNRGVEVRDVTTVAAQVDELLRPERTLAQGTGFVMLVVLLLVGIGVYGAIAQRINSRMREYAVRLALGAGLTHITMTAAGSLALPLVIGPRLRREPAGPRRDPEPAVWHGRAKPDDTRGCGAGRAYGGGCGRHRSADAAPADRREHAPARPIAPTRVGPSNDGTRADGARPLKHQGTVRLRPQAPLVFFANGIVHAVLALPALRALLRGLIASWRWSACFARWAAEPPRDEFTCSTSTWPRVPGTPAPPRDVSAAHAPTVEPAFDARQRHGSCAERLWPPSAFRNVWSAKRRGVCRGLRKWRLDWLLPKA